MATHDPVNVSREFYRDCILNSFIHTRRFASATGRVPEDGLNSPQFESVLRECAPGSLDASRRISEMIGVYLDAAGNQPGPWWRDLCSYEKAYFMQVATTQAPTPANRPRRGVSALCANFKWAMPQLLKRLESGEVITDDLQQKVTLLFARGQDAKVHIVEVGPSVEKVFRATNGLRTVEQIASAAEIGLDETQKILEGLNGIGAVELGKSAEQMLESIRARK